MRPVIGITTYAQDATWGVWHMPAALIPLDYVDAVVRAGGTPVLIPPCSVGVDETLDAVDGIVFSGGADVDPTIYGANVKLPAKDSWAGFAALVGSIIACVVLALYLVRKVLPRHDMHGATVFGGMRDRLARMRGRRDDSSRQDARSDKTSAQAARA